MLKTTAVHLRQSIIVGLGRTGKMVVDQLDVLLAERLESVPIIGRITIEPDFARSGSNIEAHHQQSRWDVILPMADDSGDEIPTAKPLGTRPLSRANKPDTGVLDTSSDPTQVRRIGHQAIRRWCDSLHKLIREVQGHVRTQDNLTAVRQRTDLKMQVDDVNLDVFIIASLEEPFSSGAFLDLTYLINNLLASERGGHFQYHTSGILFLPHYDSSSTEVDMREADTYAALKELDHFTSQQQYESGFEIRPFSYNGPPFNRSCFLVETTNEAGRSLAKLDQLTGMTSEWLYRYLTSPLPNHFQMHGSDNYHKHISNRIQAYSSFGIASYILPIDAIINVCSMRLGQEIVSDFFQRQIRRQEQDEPRGLAQTYAGDPVNIRLEGRLRTPAAVRDFQDVNPRYFDNVPIWEFDKVRERVFDLFGKRKLGQALPNIKRELQQQTEKVLEEVGQHLPREVDRIINIAPDGCLDRPHYFLEQLRELMSAEEKRWRKEAQRAHREEKQVGKDVATARAEYQSATQIAKMPAIIGVVMGLLVIIGMLIYGANIFFRLLPHLQLNSQTLNFGNTNTYAGILLIAGHLIVLGFIGIATRDWIVGARDQYIHHHRDRLRLSLIEAQKDLGARFYQQIRKLVDNEIIRLTEFRDLIDRLGEKLQKEYANNTHLLFGTLHFSLEESILTEADLDAFYQEIVDKGTQSDGNEGMGDLALELTRQQGQLSEWRTSDVNDLYERMITFGKQQMEKLRHRKSAEQLLIAHLQEQDTNDSEYQRLDVLVSSMPAGSRSEQDSTFLTIPELSGTKRQALRKQAEELFIRSRPFLRYDNIQIHADDTPTVCLLGTYSGDVEATPLNSVTEEYFSRQIQRVTTHDPHALIAMSVRHGLPLFTLGMARRYRTNYERYFQTKLLHTRRDHLALPDLFPLPDGVLEARMAVALGYAVKPHRSRTAIIGTDPASNLLFMQRGGQEGRIPLGKDKLEALIYLQHNLENLKHLSNWIDEAIVQRSEASKSGNRAIINSLQKYLKENDDQLEEWEVAMIERYIERL